jgi:NAD(P)-dependent dehydrogenase (short-subunit alcohol dehydrogenase family)
MNVAIVTGGGGGIGRAASFALANAGQGVLVLDLDGDAAEAVAVDIVSNGGQAQGRRFDVTSSRDWSGVVAAAAKLGTLTALVSNAGVFPRIAFEKTSAADFDHVMAVNLRAAFLGAAICTPAIRANGGGSLTFMTSGSGLMTAAQVPMQLGFSLYGASKAALDRWAMGIAPELSSHGIAVNLLCPGAAVHTTGFLNLALGDEAPESSITPERVAEAIVALAARRPPRDPNGRYVATEYQTGWR